MREITWLNEREFTVQGVLFECTLDNYSARTTAERFALLKDRVVLEQYARVFSESDPKSILEFGIFQGGSPALFTLWFDAVKFVGVDISPPVPEFDEFCRQHPLGGRIRAYYRVSQTDRPRIEEIVRDEFGPTPLDLIIDDASHHYRRSRRTFEIAFPLLKPGGTYVIEDWGWAHWPNSPFYKGETPLSMLLMELLMLCASRPDQVSELRVFPSFAFIRKAPNAQGLRSFSLDALYTKGGVELSGVRDLNLRGVASLLMQRLSHTMRRKFARRRGT